MEKDLLEKFNKLALQYPGPIPHSIHLEGELKQTILITAIIHGDEVGSIPALLEVIQKLIKRDNKYSITVALGNVQAYQKGVRAITHDLNRQFHNINEPSGYEQERAQELKKVLDNAFIHLDLHQTIEETLSPFCIIADRIRNYPLVQCLDITDIIISRANFNPNSHQYMTAGEYADSKEIPSITIELSKKGYNANAKSLCIKALTNIFAYLEKPYELKRELTLYKQKINIPFSQLQMSLSKEFKNLEDVTTDTQITNTLKAPINGKILFPKYPKRDEQGNAQVPVPKNIAVFIESWGKYPS